MKICILLIDCLRPDHLGCYGYRSNTSPNIDSIADKGVMFTNAFAQSNWTYPSIYSMVTGRYPSVLDITWFDQKINRGFNTLPEFLSQKGYHTGIFSPFKVLLNQESFCSHFDEMRDVRLDDTTLDVFRDWIRKHKDSFLLFHVAEYVHEPFCADEKNVEMFLEDGRTREEALASDVVRALTSRSTTGTNIRKIVGRVNKHLVSLSKTDLDYLLACYDAGICLVDKTIGEIHRMLQDHGDEYLLILSADHGQSFMEHGVVGHGLTLYDEVIRVPLIIDYNNCAYSRVSATVQLMDVCPFVLDFLGMERNFKTDGTSFMPELTGSATGDRISASEGYPNIALISDNHKLISSYSKFWEHGEIKRRFGSTKTRSRVRDVLSICLRYLPAKLYDLEKDRGEKVNLRWRERDVYNDLDSGLREIMSGIRRDTLPPEDKEIDKEVKKQLERLGYM